MSYNPWGHKELDTTEELTLAYTGSNSAHRDTIHTRTTEPCSTSPRLTDSVTPPCLHTPDGERCSEVGTGRHLWPSLMPGTQQVLKERVDTKSRCRKEEQRGISGQSSLLCFVVWNFGALEGKKIERLCHQQNRILRNGKNGCMCTYNRITLPENNAAS